MPYGDANWQRAHFLTEDIYGHDRLAKALLRTVPRLAPGSLVAVHGAPGSGKSELVGRLGALVHEEARAGRSLGIHPNVVYYNPWVYGKQGHVLSGLVAHVAKIPLTGGNAPLERARDIANYVGRMTFDGSMGTGFGSVLSEGDNDPFDRVQRGFTTLVEQVKGGAPGRLLVLVDGLDLCAPVVRFQFIDGLRLMLQTGADVTIVMAIGREAALAAVRHRDGPVSDASAQREWDELVTLTVTVPNVEPRRVLAVLRRSLGTSKAAVQRAFGDEAVGRLGAAVAHWPLGSPRFLHRLALRAVLLAEFAVEVRATRELSAAQWAWLVVGERWPEFRRFMIRGGQERWLELQEHMHMVSQGLQQDDAAQRPQSASAWLKSDPLLGEYLKQHTDELVRDIDGVYWMENLLLAAGL